MTLFVWYCCPKQERLKSWKREEAAFSSSKIIYETIGTWFRGHFKEINLKTFN